MSAARTIHLRRPATLSVQEGVFLPPNELLDESEHRWNALCTSNPAYYDGRLYHVLGVHRNGHGGAVLHVIDCAYRFFAVQNEEFDLGVRPLGVKGVVEREGQYLMGRRSQRVASYRGLWEFAPAGSVEPPHQPPEVIRSELLEETGLELLHEPVPIAAIFDPVLRCWELVYRLHTANSEFNPRTSEYSELQWRHENDLPGELSAIAQQIAGLLFRNR